MDLKQNVFVIIALNNMNTWILREKNLIVKFQNVNVNAMIIFRLMVHMILNVSVNIPTRNMIVLVANVPNKSVRIVQGL